MEKSNFILKLILLIGLLAVSSSAMTIDEAMTAYVIDHYQLDATTTQVEILSSGIKVRDFDPSKLEIKPMSDREPVGLLSFYCRLADGEQVIDKGQVQVRIRRFAEVLVASHQLPRATIVGNGEFESKQIETTNLREQPITDLGAYAGFRLKRNIAVGQPLTVEALETIPAVESGQDVSITYEQGGIQLSTTGQALQHGRIGELIKVRNKASGKMLYATIVSSGKVSVTP